jgi:LmbE family N-acetylglucosaminyl deacetylase
MRKTGWFRRFCEWGARRLLARLHRVTHRMPVELRNVQTGRVLIVAPHFDDEVIGTGGTLALHKDAGSTIGVVYVSDSAGDSAQTGSASQTAVRKAEAEACSRQMSFEIVGILDFPDGNLSRHEDRIATRLKELLESWKPTQIICPFLTDHHRDHEATASAVALAIRLANWDGEVWGFEVWSTLWPNAVIDITQVVERKKAGIACHASQLENMAYVEAALGLNRYRGLRVGVPYGEAFYVCSAAEFVKLASRLLYRV